MTKEPRSRGLHSFTFQLNVSAFYEIGGTSRGYSGSVSEVSRVVAEIQGAFLCQKRLRLS